MDIFLEEKGITLQWAIRKWARTCPSHIITTLFRFSIFMLIKWLHGVVIIAIKRRSQVMQNHGLPWPLPWPSPIAVTFRPWAQIQIQMQKADTNTNTYSNENTNRLTSTNHQAEPCRRLHSVLGSKWPAIKIGLWVMNNLSTQFPQNLFHLKVRLQAKVGIGINLGFQPKEHRNGI